MKIKLNTTILIIGILLITNIPTYSTTYYEAYKNVFGGELIKKYPNANKSKADCEKLVEEYSKNFEILNNQSNTGMEILLKEIYCNPDMKESLKIVDYKGYHDLDDKSRFWIPKNLNPLMMTNNQLEPYRIVTAQMAKKYNMNSIFIQQKIKQAFEENRPLIDKDLKDASKDSNILKNIEDALDDSGDGYTVYNQLGSTPTLPELTQKQEKDLETLINQYGEEILSDDFKRKLKLYRQRQEYIKNNTPKGVQGFRKLQNFYNQYLSY